MRDHVHLSRRGLVAALTVAVVAAAAAGAALAASSTPAGGTFHEIGSSAGGGGGGKVLITGAIGDHGTSQTVNKAGKPDQNGSFVKLSLTQGTITLNKTKLDVAVNKAFNSAAINSATCSVQVAASAGLPFTGGTGLYTGISGTADITLVYGFILPRKASGACNESNGANPTAAQQITYGGGTVSFK